jgi:hypothetical protein
MWLKVKYFLNGEARRDRRMRKALTGPAGQALQKKMREDDLEERRHRLRKAVIIAVDHGEYGSERPYKGCLTPEHFDVIMRNRVVLTHVGDKMVYELNTKGLADWEVEEFHFMLLEDTEHYPQTPIIREVMSDRFPQ